MLKATKYQSETKHGAWRSITNQSRTNQFSPRGISEDISTGCQGINPGGQEAGRRDVVLTATSRILQVTTFQNVQPVKQHDAIIAKRQGITSGHAAGREVQTVDALDLSMARLA